MIIKDNNNSLKKKKKKKRSVSLENPWVIHMRKMFFAFLIPERLDISKYQM